MYIFQILSTSDLALSTDTADPTLSDLPDILNMIDESPFEGIYFFNR